MLSQVKNPAGEGRIADSPETLNGCGFASKGSAHSPSNLHGQDQVARQQTPAAGQVLLSQGQTYVGATHWAAILEDARTIVLNNLYMLTHSR